MSAAAAAPAAPAAAAAPAPAAATPPAAAPAAEGGSAPAAAGANPAPVQNSSLYVGDLDRDATEASLYELFSQVGPVASIRVCRDAVTRRSLGYAYVNYNSALDPQAAERALDSLNYTVVNGRPIRIMWSHRDPAFRRSGLGNIFIKNLDRSIDHKALHDTFSQFGNILSCKVATDAAGNSRGYGFVHFETEEAATLAQEKVNGMQLQDKVVYVGPFQKRVERGDEGAGPRFTNVYVKNLPEDCDDAGLRLIAEESGEVTSAVVMRDADGNPRGFGFVNFADPTSAAKCVEAVNGREREGRTLWAGRAQKKAERESMLRQRFEEARNERVAKYQGLNLYVKNLPGDDGSGAPPFTDDDLRQEFAPFGSIASAKVMVDERDKSRGFGFVCYTSAEEATRAVTEMNGRMLRGKPLYVALAQRKEVRRAQLQQQLQQQRLAMAAAAAAGGRPGPGGAMPMPPGGVFPGAGGPGMFYPGGPGGMPGGPGGPMMGPGGPRGMAAGPGGLVYPGAMMGGRGGGFMGGRGGGPRGGPGGMMMMGPGGPMGPMGPGGPMGGPMGGPPFMAGPGGMVGPMGGRGGRGGMGGRGGRGPGGPYDMAGPDGGRGRGFGAAVAGRGRGRGPAGGRGMGEGGAPGAPAGAPGAPPAPAAPQQVSLTAMLANATPEQQKEILGERLFPQVAALQPVLAGKVTGMLLEMDNPEVLLLLDNADALVAKVDEAIDVLKQHGALSGEGEAPAEGAAAAPAAEGEEAKKE